MIRRIVITVMIATIALLILAVGVNWKYQQLIHQTRNCDVQLVIKTGQSLDQIARQLEQQGVISSTQVFRLYTRWQQQGHLIKAGEYAFVGEFSMIDVLNRLHEGKVIMHRLTIVEGLRTADILNKLAQQSNTDVALWQSAMDELSKGKEQEGRLLPETYSYTEPVNPRFLLRKMMQAQQQVLADLDVPQPQETIIIASIIEKETAIPAERALISAVIRNRLKKAMPLQMDPTVIYGLWRDDPNFKGPLHHNDLKKDTPWNSYTRSGLPPSPICNPGRESLKAAAEPADADFLFFVATGKGGHRFAVTHQEHQRNIRRWLKERKAQQ
jgi:UPF0755 protein